jgi:hypothetical protein
MSDLDRDELRQIITALADARRRTIPHGPELDAYLEGIDDLAAELIGRGHVLPPAPTRNPPSHRPRIVVASPDAGRRRQNA